MPVYNAERYLAEAIDSIIGQSFTNWELVVINDGSTDNSEKIIQSFNDPRIKYYKNEQNIQLIETLNRGIALCSGKYIARMDADDIAHPHRLKKQVEAMEADSRLTLCGTNAVVIDENGNETGKIVNPGNNSFLQISLLFTNPFIHPSMMIRRDRLGDDRFNAEALHVEDFELWTRLANRGRLANINRPLLKYRWHSSNVSVAHAKRQNEMKERIIGAQLDKQLNIAATDQEISIHRLTFNLYEFGKKKNISADKATEVARWFRKLSGQNRKLRRFSPSDFEAFLWCRWIVLCVCFNKKSKVFFPDFVRFTPAVIFKTLKLVLYLSRK